MARKHTQQKQKPFLLAFLHEPVYNTNSFAVDRFGLFSICEVQRTYTGSTDQNCDFRSSFPWSGRSCIRGLWIIKISVDTLNTHVLYYRLLLTYSKVSLVLDHHFVGERNNAMTSPCVISTKTPISRPFGHQNRFLIDFNLRFLCFRKLRF